LTLGKLQAIPARAEEETPLYRSGFAAFARRSNGDEYCVLIVNASTCTQRSTQIQ
jgi:hypothetical protein